MKKTTAERLQEIMNIRNLKQADVVRLCQPYADKLGIKFQKSALSQYISGRNEPNQYKLTVLALALNVNETWLMGFDVPMQREKITHHQEVVIPEKKNLELHNLLDMLDDIDRAEIRGMMKQMLRADKYKEKSNSKLA